MRLAAIYTRFFRSLNYDYVRLSSPDYTADPWDATPDGKHYPFVRLRLEDQITTVVGANEAGKTQVLKAVSAALTGVGFERSDFCRYSPFFFASEDLTVPEFGAEFRGLSEDDIRLLEKACNASGWQKVDRVALFRPNSASHPELYVHSNAGWLDPVAVSDLEPIKTAGLPKPFYIDAHVPLPDSVPIDFLATGTATGALGRNILKTVWDAVSGNQGWFATKETVTRDADAISKAFQTTPVTDADLKKFSLAADLLLKVAGLNRELFIQLQKSVRSKDGYASSIVDRINTELSKALNFPHWWSQDSHFELFVALFEYDLVFMIRDRTGRSYGFDERSDGLKYFLSYFVQYLAHETPADGQREVLLMDEPDRFLSSSGQQDLLRIFADFAEPADETRTPVQVLYVTHSPFLIDKNHAERIRVLEKGEHDEGTRVVASVAQNHYEPLRSAFGGFVGETAFIGTCNLMLEGASDQILLAGISSWLGRRGVPELQRLDLNAITLVPAGGVSEVPYLIYLARGRDIEQPAVIALLDGDGAGTEARALIRRGGARKKPLIPDELVLQLTDEELSEIASDNPHGAIAIEDLIPLELIVAAAAAHCSEFIPDIDIRSLDLSREAVFGAVGAAPVVEPLPGRKGVVDALEHAVRIQAAQPTFLLNKIALARGVVALLDGNGSPGEQLAMLEANFRRLFAALGRRQRAAVRAESVDRISSRINRTRGRFLREHATSATREHVQLLIEEIDSQLDNSNEAEAVRAELRSWHRHFRLDEDLRENIENIDALRDALLSLAYLGKRMSEIPSSAASSVEPTPASQGLAEPAVDIRDPVSDADGDDVAEGDMAV